jgi:hypothetical protein
MHSAHIAEWMLALVTTRDRAASTVGDLTEQAATRGVVWFWLSVFRTTASFLWRGVAERPARLTGLALLGIAVYVGIDLLFAGLDGVAFFIAAYRSGSHVQVGSVGWKIWFAAPVLVSSLLIGQMLARWAPGRELAACVVYAVLVTIYNLAPMLGDNGGVTALMCILIVPVGAAWGRYRRLGATRPGLPVDRK